MCSCTSHHPTLTGTLLLPMLNKSLRSDPSAIGPVTCSTRVGCSKSYGTICLRAFDVIRSSVLRGESYLCVDAR